MKAKFTLHTHDNTVSYDSYIPFSVRAKLYKTMGFDALGVVGHDNISQYDSDDLIIINGVEHTVSEDPEIHIVELPEIGFRYLAHPKRVDGNNTRETAMNIIRERNLDGVEKYNDGSKQYDGSLDTIELASDDAHNLIQTCTSYMKADVDAINRGQIVSAIKTGNFEMKNKRSRILGDVSKGLTSSLGSLTTEGR